LARNRQHTVVLAIVSRNEIAVVTGLHATPDVTIAASGGDTIPKAFIVVAIVSIVAGFVSRLAHRKVLTTEAIAASRGNTVVGTGSGIAVLLTVVASLTFADHAVAAPCLSTVWPTAISWLVVAVIAAFPRPENAIATRGQTTAVGTAIYVDLVAIITFLHANSKASVTTTGWGAIDAGIVIVVVAIIAALIFFMD